MSPDTTRLNPRASREKRFLQISGPFWAGPKIRASPRKRAKTRPRVPKKGENPVPADPLKPVRRALEAVPNPIQISPLENRPEEPAGRPGSAPVGVVKRRPDGPLKRHRTGLQLA